MSEARAVQDFALYYRRPAFRPGVRVEIGADRAVFGYDGLSFDVEFSESAREPVEALCAGLAEGLDPAVLAGRHAGFAPHAAELIGAFDRYGLITEADPPAPDDAIPGAAFWLEVEAFAERVRRRCRPVLHEALLDGRIGRDGLIGYAIEYFHVVRAGPAIIAAVLPHAHGRRTRTLLEGFLESELRHDAMLAGALAAAGVATADLEAALPLPETFAIVTAMTVMAAQEPLSFKATAFLLEDASPEFHAAFAAACRREGLGDGFLQPILRHAGINDEGQHGSISRTLLSEVSAVSPEERLVVLKQVATMIESLAALEHAILARWGRAP